MSKQVEFPSRLGWGKGIKGRDWPGCSNSGSAPILIKSQAAAKYLEKPFFVGGAGAWEWHKVEIITAAMHGKRHPEAVRWNARFFKTYGAAKAHFQMLTDKVSEQYGEVGHLIRQAKAAKTVDEFAAIGVKLMEHGVAV